VYGLLQAGILANKLLTKQLALHGYAPTAHTPGLWQHKTNPMTFTLVVDNFGFKYARKQHVKHLYRVLTKYYEASTGWDGNLYFGLTLKWNYKAHTANFSMPGYVAAELHKFQHTPPRQPCHAPVLY
jgi:hypothetical protein